MKPVLFELGGLSVTSYGVSKALAAAVAGLMLWPEYRRRGRSPNDVYTLVLTVTVAGFLGGKLYYLAERAGDLSANDFGGYGFTWFGGFLAGALTAVAVARRQGFSAAEIAGVAAAPLAVAYGVGRLGCLLAGDGTYGEPSSLPWAISFPDGTVPTTERVHPTPLYEAIGAFAVGALLWRLRHRLAPLALFSLYAVLMGSSRFLVEFIRINPEAAFGLSAPQLWSLALITAGTAVAYWARSSGRGLLGKAHART